MFLNQYFTAHTDKRFSFSREQASSFAKLVANDFNPIHDVDSRRFCVPGDLLFARILTEEGVHASLRVQFNGMVSDSVPLQISGHDQGGQRKEGRSVLVDETGREYLEVCRSGGCIRDEQLIEKLIRSYVSFSGKNFPHVLVPLMKDSGVMINPSRPLVVYESMSVDLDRTDLVDPVLKEDGAFLEVDGRRGNVTLNFVFHDQGEIVGRGKKTMVLSSLREFEQSAMDELVSHYFRRRESFQVAA